MSNFNGLTEAHFESQVAKAVFNDKGQQASNPMIRRAEMILLKWMESATPLQILVPSLVSANDAPFLFSCLRLGATHVEADAKHGRTCHSVVSCNPHEQIFASGSTCSDCQRPGKGRPFCGQKSGSWS